MYRYFKTTNVQSLKGFLVDITPDNICEIWFPYSLEVMTLLSPGVFLAAKNILNYNPIESLIGERYSILQVLQKTAIHFKIQDIKSNPRRVLVEKEFDEAHKDWQRRIGDPEKDTLRIIIKAELTEGEIIISDQGMGVSKQLAEPIMGSEVYILTSDVINQFINVELAQKNVVTLAPHKLYDQVPVAIDYNSLITRHFGIFGFTGSGKSNLVSTLLSKIIIIDQEDKSASNIFVFDVNNEYITLF